MVGGRGRAMHGAIARFSRTRTHVCVRRWDLTEPKRGIHLLNPSDCTSYITELERSIPWLLTKHERFLRYYC